MVHSEQHYRDAAQGLKGELGSTFGKSSLNDAAVSNIHRLANFNDNAEMMGLRGGSVAGVQDRGVSLARSINESHSAQDEKAKKSFDNVLFLNLLEQQSRELGEKIAKMETSFEAKYGDAWRETIANQVLDPDEIPEKRDDETIIEYRERLEVVLIDKMIDPSTGKMKPEYSSDPEMREWGQWAEDQVAKGKVDTKIDQVNEIANNPNLTEAEKLSETQALASEMDLVELVDMQQSEGVHNVALSVAAAEAEIRTDNIALAIDPATSNAAF